MPLYKWQGRTVAGRFVSGALEAPDRRAVLRHLRRQRIRPDAARIRKGTPGLARAISLPTFGRPASATEIMVFTRQFYTMVDSGMSIVGSLEVLASQTRTKSFRDILVEVRRDVAGGATLASAMSRHPAVFDNLFVNMVGAGETGGVLPEVLNRLASFIEKSARLKKKLYGAMVYPLTILAVALITVVILLVYVIPVFSELYDSMGQSLPMATEIAIRMSRWARDYWAFLSFGGMAAAGAAGLCYRTERGRRVIDTLLLQIPVLGDLLRKTAVARFAYNTSILVGSGVALLEVLNITARTAGNKTVEEAIRFARSSIKEGKTIAEPLLSSAVFPPIVAHMVSIGERTGRLDEMLQKVSEFYEEEVDRAVTNLVNLLEPVMMILLGTVLGGLVISMYLPIFQLGSLMGQ